MDGGPGESSVAGFLQYTGPLGRGEGRDPLRESSLSSLDDSQLKQRKEDRNWYCYAKSGQ